jgi:hypothetical protein
MNWNAYLEIQIINNPLENSATRLKYGGEFT